MFAVVFFVDSELSTMPHAKEAIVMGEEQLEFIGALAKSVRRYCIYNGYDGKPQSHEYYFDLVKTLYWEMSIRHITDVLPYYDLVRLIARAMY